VSGRGLRGNGGWGGRAGDGCGTACMCTVARSRKGERWTGVQQQRLSRMCFPGTIMRQPRVHRYVCRRAKACARRPASLPPSRCCRNEEARMRAVVAELSKANRKLLELVDGEAQWAAKPLSQHIATMAVGPLTKEVGAVGAPRKRTCAAKQTAVAHTHTRAQTHARTHTHVRVRMHACNAHRHSCAQRTTTCVHSWRTWAPGRTDAYLGSQRRRCV
jgi:hypothetical protein